MNYINEISNPSVVARSLFRDEVLVVRYLGMPEGFWISASGVLYASSELREKFDRFYAHLETEKRRLVDKWYSEDREGEDFEEFVEVNAMFFQDEED